MDNNKSKGIILGILILVFTTGNALLKSSFIY